MSVCKYTGPSFETFPNPPPRRVAGRRRLQERWFPTTWCWRGAMFSSKLTEEEEGMFGRGGQPLSLDEDEGEGEGEAWQRQKKPPSQKPSSPVRRAWLMLVLAVLVLRAWFSFGGSVCAWFSRAHTAGASRAAVSVHSGYRVWRLGLASQPPPYRLHSFS